MVFPPLVPSKREKNVLSLVLRLISNLTNGLCLHQFLVTKSEETNKTERRKGLYQGRMQRNYKPRASTLRTKYVQTYVVWQSASCQWKINLNLLLLFQWLNLSLVLLLNSNLANELCLHQFLLTKTNEANKSQKTDANGAH